MNIKNLIKDITQKINDKVNKPEPAEVNKLTFTFQDNQNFSLQHNLNDDQLEGFVNLLINDVGLNYLLELLSVLNPEQFQRIFDRMKLKIILNESNEENADKPIAQVVFQNE